MLVLFMLVGSGVGPAGAAAPQWTIFPSPNEGDDENGFADVARIPGTQRFWAVGYGTDLFEDTPERTIIARWNGAAWKRIESLNVGEQDNRLFGVTARSPSDAWAVGSREDPGGVSKTLIEHWDGTSWTVVPSPNAGAAGNANTLRAVKAFSGADAWAVGESTSNGTLTLHWDGAVWTKVPAPDVAGFQCRLNAITGVPGSGRRFAVGECQDQAGVERALIERWNGTAWTIVPAPSEGSSSFLTDITAVSGHELWAVGATRPEGSVNDLHTLTMRWNGSSWTVIASPSASAPVDRTVLLGVTTVPGSSTLWTVGYATDLAGGTRPFSEFWDGAGWTVVPTGAGLPGIAESFSDVAAAGPRDVWAVGGWFDPDVERAFTLVEHYA